MSLSPGWLSGLLPWIMAAFVLALVLNAVRLLRGPALADRILALDTLYVNALALLVVVGLSLADKVYLEVALLVGLLGFVGTVALALFVKRGDIAS
jgi:multicomponent K+:H+ antiporter subunit F